MIHHKIQEGNNFDARWYCPCDRRGLDLEVVAFLFLELYFGVNPKTAKHLVLKKG